MMRNKSSKKKWQALQNRFNGLIQFLKRTPIRQHGKPVYLNELPWYLVIGPEEAGKTALLAHSKIRFILQPQHRTTATDSITPSEHCDFWVTRDACLVDIPSSYLALPTPHHTPAQKEGAALWAQLLRLIHKKRGKKGIRGIVLTLPLPSLLALTDPKPMLNQWSHLLLRFNELRAQFAGPLPCYLVITKCDLIPGFSEFFSESSDDDITQRWGIVLPQLKEGEKIEPHFVERFHALIKKLNHQLLFRLHQERDPIAKLAIKDFPMQLERLKTLLLQWFKQPITHHEHLPLQGIYLTSALQEEQADDAKAPQQNAYQQAIQIFSAPNISRGYFIKQLILQELGQDALALRSKTPSRTWQPLLPYVLSAGLVLATGTLLGKDFRLAMQQTNAIQQALAHYQLTTENSPNPRFRLPQTATLMQQLQQLAEKEEPALDHVDLAYQMKQRLKHVLTFYSDQSRQASTMAYRHAQKYILLPEIKNYLGEYLKQPTLDHADMTYTTLQSYLMLQDKARCQPQMVIHTLNQLLPDTMRDDQAALLMQDVQEALTGSAQPLSLDEHLIETARQTLAALPPTTLSEVILNNTYVENTQPDLNLSDDGHLVFNNDQLFNHMPPTFTARAFSTITAQGIPQAVQEALHGNWVIGVRPDTPEPKDMTADLQEVLRHQYIHRYVAQWEKAVNAIQLAPAKNLQEMDMLIESLASPDSPLQRLLQVIHDNTYFEPIASESTTLKQLGALADTHHATDARAAADPLLKQIMSQLQQLHRSLQAVLGAPNEKKAALDFVRTNPLQSLHLLAEKSPAPIRQWLDHIAETTWQYLLLDATTYVNTPSPKQPTTTTTVDLAPQKGVQHTQLI
jgi:type VI secretion system protein ImpL